LTATDKTVLQGWKEIADYVSRDERTVKRWEKQRHLPVRRMPGSGRTNVYILISDLDDWLSRSYPSAIPSIVTVPQRRWPMMAAISIAALVLVASFVAARAPDKPASSGSLYTSSHVAGVDDLYLRGVYSYEKRTPESLNYAEQLLHQATVKDPTYAPAWSGLAITHLLCREYGSMPEPVAYAKARDEAQHALTLNPSQADARAALAFIHYFWDERPSTAEPEFLAAIRLNPNSALAHHWYGSMLTHEGRFPEAIQQLDAAQRLQPNSTAILASRAYALGLSGHRDEAIELLQSIAEQDPNYSGAHFNISVLCMAPPANPSCALREQRRWATLMHNDDLLAENAVADRAYRSGGEPAMWRSVLHWQKARHPAGGTLDIAVAEAALSHNDDALADLQKLAANHDTLIMGINMNLEFRALRSDPRFHRLDASIGLPQLP